jgi:hypothetical protein
MKITVIVGSVAALALSSSAFAQFSQRKVFENPWDVTARTRMENDGWTFASTFGIPERMCYAMPPGKQWPTCARRRLRTAPSSSRRARWTASVTPTTRSRSRRSRSSQGARAGKCEVVVSRVLWKAVMAERGRSRSRGRSTPRRARSPRGLSYAPQGERRRAYSPRRVPDRNMAQGLRVDRGAALTADAPPARAPAS